TSQYRKALRMKNRISITVCHTKQLLPLTQLVGIRERFVWRSSGTNPLGTFFCTTSKIFHQRHLRP
ncbi:MAG: hypothetical protein WCA34_10415, partial [Candidatus Acidiferrales bacterium]